MNIRCKLHAGIAAFIIALAAMFLAPAAGKAQVIDCRFCDHFTFAVNAGLNCSVTICYEPSLGSTPLCLTVAPGGSVRIPCSVYRAWVKTCSGDYFLIPSSAISNCSPQLKFATACCGQICNVPSIDPCTKIEVQPLPCSSISCP